MILGFDVETTALDPYLPGARMLTAAVWGPRIRWSGRGDDRRALLGMLNELSNPEATVVGHNLGFDVCWIERWLGIRVQARLWDTMVAQFRLDENAENSLGAVAERWLGEKKLDVDRRKLEEVPIEDVLAYNLRDAELARKLHAPMAAALEAQGLSGLFEQDMRLLRCLVDVRHRGVLVDWRKLAKIDRDTAEEIRRREESLRQVAQVQDLNLRSPKQVGELMYGAMDLPVLARTATGSASTGKEAIALLAADASIPEAYRGWVREYGEVKKLMARRSSFTTKWPEHRGVDDRIHSTFNLGRSVVERRGKGARESEQGTVTGRLSSTEPNLQNVPKRDAVLRPCFVPAKGWRFAKGDYSQIELRVAGWLSGDPAMRGIFERGEDFHTATLAQLEGVPYEQAVERVVAGEWKAKRDACKRVNFGAIYGAWPEKIWKVARTDGFDADKGLIQRVWDGQREVFAEFWRWSENVHRIVRRDLQVRSPFGGIRRLPEAGNEYQWWLRKEAERQAVNFLVQNAALEILRHALLAIETSMYPDFRTVLTVHDEIVVEYRGFTKREAADRLRTCMILWTEESLLADGLPEVEHLHLEASVAAGLTRWGALE